MVMQTGHSLFYNLLCKGNWPEYRIWGKDERLPPAKTKLVPKLYHQSQVHNFAVALVLEKFKSIAFFLLIAFKDGLPHKQNKNHMAFSTDVFVELGTDSWFLILSMEGLLQWHGWKVPLQEPFTDYSAFQSPLCLEISS